MRLSSTTRFALSLALAMALVQVPFLDRPVNYDEANFLVLARGALLDPWAPHHVTINWQGRTESAFDVLSNPPGIAWFLACVQAFAGDSIVAQRIAMLAWTLPTALGATLLADELCPSREARLRAAALVSMPMALLSGSALLPDAPLYALTLLGLGGVLRSDRTGGSAWGWALLAGGTALFRYSGLALLPLVLWAARRRPGALAVLAPIALLTAHDLVAYGQPHLLAMGRFQSVSNGAEDWVHKAASALTFLGGALVLPIFRWRAPQVRGALIGAVLAMRYGTGVGAAQAAAFGAAGGAALGGGVAGLLRAEDRWLGAWATGGFAFLLLLRFTAARYWLPFAPAVLLLSPFGGAPAVVVSGVLGLALLADDERSARAVAELADRAADSGPPGVFTGHWGWQWELERRGWKALDEGARAPPGALLAMPVEAWPQSVNTVCLQTVFDSTAEVHPAWLPRAYSGRDHANLHANWIAGQPPVRTVIPWTFSTDRYEAARVCSE